MQFVKVPKKDGERIRKEFEAKGLISHEYSITSDSKFLFIPVTQLITGYHVVKKRGKKRDPKPKNLTDALKGILTEDERASITKSFDALGSLAIVEIPQNLISKEKKIAGAIMEIHPLIKTVAKKTGAMSGKFRVRPLKVIGGKKSTKTVYKESGVSMILDPSQVYFSPRLSHERTRIAGMVKPDEHILVLFAGVGPFALVIAKSNPTAKILAVELNQTACNYMKENVARNEFSNIEVVWADAHDACKTYSSWADRIIMPLPHTAHEFLGDAFRAARTGCVVHFYTMCEKINAPQNAIDIVLKEAKNAKGTVLIIGTRIARPYSAQIDQIVVDFKIKK